MPNKIFTDKDIKHIANLTEKNHHTESMLFIATKIKSKTAKEFKKIKDQRNKIGYLTPELSDKRNKLSKKLMNELKKKSPKEHDEVYRAL